MVAKTRKTAKSSKSSTAKKKVVVSKAKAAPAEKMLKKISTIKDPLTKTAMLGMLCEMTGFTKKQVLLVLDAFFGLMEASVKKNSAGEFTVPGYFKIVTVKKPATKARKGINPFTGEEVMFKAKPARNVLKIKALKKLKDIV